MHLNIPSATEGRIALFTSELVESGLIMLQKKSSWSRTGSRIQILIRIGRVELNPDPVGFLLIRAKTIQQLKGKQWATHNRKN